ncbi:hypothetical protein ERN12_12800 [Rhodobacteraceae bacterium]|nr:hypothetical protein ERN12_12800 [Paracoccaceae bacterium]
MHWFFVSPAPDPIVIHPLMAVSCRERAAGLIAGLVNSTGIPVAKDALQSLVERLVLMPDADIGRLSVDLERALARLLWLTVEAEGRLKRKNPPERVMRILLILVNQYWLRDQTTVVTYQLFRLQFNVAASTTNISNLYSSKQQWLHLDPITTFVLHLHQLASPAGRADCGLSLPLKTRSYRNIETDIPARSRRRTRHDMQRGRKEALTATNTNGSDA